MAYVEIEFFYRDGGNYKWWYPRTFEASDEITQEKAEKMLRDALDGWEFIDRDALGLDIELPYETGEIECDENLDDTTLEILYVKVKESYEPESDAFLMPVSFESFVEKIREWRHGKAAA